MKDITPNTLSLLQNPHSYILVGSKHKGDYLDKKQVIYAKSAVNYTWLYLISGSRYLSCKPIGYYEEFLRKDNFIRIHRSYLINLLNVKYYEQKYRLVHLKGGITLSVSYRRSRSFLRNLKAHNNLNIFFIEIVF
ncbi:LytR/AlgR family response regulator transcription factor [Kordia sp.]|uniref:LytR/AlgR family response regulator transcription factor n=1 Tax=Kordia sp. TaxID=1965332 RepID=UPI003B58E45B